MCRIRPYSHDQPIRYLGTHPRFDGSWEVQHKKSLSLILLFTRLVDKFSLHSQTVHMLNTVKLELALMCCCHSFLAMPVLSASDGRLVSYIDMLDLVWYTLWSFGAWRAEVSREDIMESRAHFGEYLQLDRFRNATVLDCIGRSGFGTRNQATHVYKGFSLFHVFETMARINAHRIGQSNTTGRG